MRFIELTAGQRKEISHADVAAIKKPYMLFLGGLLHVQDLDTGGNFPLFLSKLSATSTTRIILPLDETVTSTGDLTQYMYAYGRNQAAPSQFMEDIYNTLMKPRVDQTDFSDPDECSALRKNLSHIGLVGYSYGTSLIQQLSEIAAHGITSRAKAQGLDNPGLRAASALSAVKAVNIGPVAKFKHIDAEGHINMLEADDPHHADALTLFSQVSVLMSDDKIVQRSYGHELLGGVMSSEIGIEVRDTVTTSTYTDYVGLPNHAGIGTFVLPDGQRFPKIITAFDYMIHDLRSYMNVQEVQGNIAIYPSFAVAPILRASTAQMFNATQTGDQWLASLRNQFSSASSRHDLVTFFREQRTEFNALVMAFREAVYQDAIPMLANHVNGLRARLAGINSDALPNPAPQRQIS